MESEVSFDQFAKADRSELVRTPKVSPWVSVIQQFAESGEDCVSRRYESGDKLTRDTSRARAAANKLANTLEVEVRVCQRGDKMYLLRGDKS